MRRNRTIIATRLGLALNILEMIAVIIATFIMTILGLVFKELVESFNGESGIYIFFKIGGVSIIFAIFVLVAIISLMAAGKKVKITADYSAEDYKNKSILHKLYIVFNFIVVAILTAIAAAFVIAVFASASVFPDKSGTSTCSIPILTYIIILVPAGISVSFSISLTISLKVSTVFSFKPYIGVKLSQK